MNRIGPMVATLARANGTSFSALALELGMHRNRLADKIAGRRPFQEGEILALAEFFGVPPGRLFDDPRQLLGITSELPPSDPACVTAAEGVLSLVRMPIRPARRRLAA